MVDKLFRTLDQSFYYTLEDTSLRDRTQVVSRWIRRDYGIGNSVDLTTKREAIPHNILMVDQLWLWVIQRTGYPDTIITSFPGRKGADASVLDDIQKQVTDNGSRSKSRDVSNLVGRILAVCCRTLSPSQDDKSVAFLQFFENSVARVVSI